jgi:hypothetical protein
LKRLCPGIRILDPARAHEGRALHVTAHNGTRETLKGRNYIGCKRVMVLCVFNRLVNSFKQNENNLLRHARNSLHHA